jgi:hypothetical protein
MTKVHDEMMVKLTIDGMVVWTRLNNFLEENEFTKTELKEMREHLRKGKPYHSGGGAFAYWKLEADK